MQCAMQCMIVHEWNVWAFKFIFIWACFVILFRVCCLSCLCALYGLAFLTCYASVLSSKKHFVLRTFYRITTFPMLGVWMLWFFDSFLIRKQLDFLFLCWIFNLDFHVVNKFNINNENLPKQCTYSIHVNKIKCTLHPKKQVLKG